MACTLESVNAYCCLTVVYAWHIPEVNHATIFFSLNMAELTSCSKTQTDQHCMCLWYTQLYVK